MPGREDISLSQVIMFSRLFLDALAGFWDIIFNEFSNLQIRDALKLKCLAEHSFARFSPHAYANKNYNFLKTKIK